MSYVQDWNCTEITNCTFEDNFVIYILHVKIYMRGKRGREWVSMLYSPTLQDPLNVQNVFIFLSEWRRYVTIQAKAKEGHRFEGNFWDGHSLRLLIYETRINWEVRKYSFSFSDLIQGKIDKANVPQDFLIYGIRITPKMLGFFF